MSLYWVQQCLFDHLRRLEKAQPGQRPPVQVDGYELTDDERRALREADVGALYRMGTHPVLINGFCRANGYRRADYRVLFGQGTAAGTTRRARWQTS